MAAKREIVVDGVAYRRLDLTPAIDATDKPFVIVRGDCSGVFAGTLISRSGRDVVLAGVYRIWRWEGAASLSQLAMSGTSRPEKCKIPEMVDLLEVLDAIEVLHCTEKSKKSIEGVPTWKC